MRTLFSTLLWVCVVVASAQHPRLTGHAGPGTPIVASADADDAPPLVVFPGANAGRVYVEWGDRSLTRMPVEVRTMEGRLVRLDCISPQQDLDLSELPSGHYRLFLLDLRGVRAEQTFTLPVAFASL